MRYDDDYKVSATRPGGSYGARGAQLRQSVLMAAQYSKRVKVIVSGFAFCLISLALLMASRYHPRNPLGPEFARYWRETSQGCAYTIPIEYPQFSDDWEDSHPEMKFAGEIEYRNSDVHVVIFQSPRWLVTISGHWDKPKTPTEITYQRRYPSITDFIDFRGHFGRGDEESK